MPAHLSVYCKRSVSHVTAAEVRAALADVPDFYTLAEGFGIEDEAVVDAAMDMLRVEDLGIEEIRLQISYRPPELRPIVMSSWTETEMLAELCSEQRECIDTSYAEGAAVVDAHLNSVVEVVSFELGWSQLEDMGVVIAGQVAEYIARIGDGLIVDQNDDWWTIGEHGIPKILVGPERRT
jgi:hypothetical protein